MVCVECGAVAGFQARGWRGYLADDAELVFYCRGCALSEFGPIVTRPLPMPVEGRERDLPPPPSTTDQPRTLFEVLDDEDTQGD